MGNIEDKLNHLYQEKLGNLEKDPPPQVWSGIKQGLMIKKLITFKVFTSLNVYSATTFIVVAALTGFFAGKYFTAGKIAVEQKSSTPVEIAAPQNNLKNQQIKEQSLLIESKQINTQRNTESFNKQYHQLTNNTKVNPLVIKNPEDNNLTEKPLANQDNMQSVPEILTNQKPENTIPDIPVVIPEKMQVKIDNTEKNEVKPPITLKELKNEPAKTFPDQPKSASDELNTNLLPKKPKTIQGIYAEIFGAPSLIKLKFEQSSVNPNLTFVNSSRQDEKPALSYTAGAELGYGLRHLFVQTGINYSDYRSNAIIDISDNYLATVTNLNWDSILIFDSMGNYYKYFYDTIRSFVQRDTLITHRSANSTRYIEFPILIGYRFYGKRMSYAIMGGISIGYLSSSGGKVLNPDVKSITTNTPDAVPYKSFTYYFVLRADAAYMINKNLSIFIRPGFKYNWNSIFEDYYPVQKTFYTVDLHFGLRYHF